MIQRPSEMMEKARAKRRRQETKTARKEAGKNKASSSNAEESLTEKVMDLAQEAAVQVGALVKTAATKITGAAERTQPRRVSNRAKSPRLR